MEPKFRDLRHIILPADAHMVPDEAIT